MCKHKQSYDKDCEIETLAIPDFNRLQTLTLKELSTIKVNYVEHKTGMSNVTAFGMQLHWKDDTFFASLKVESELEKAKIHDRLPKKLMYIETRI